MEKFSPTWSNCFNNPISFVKAFSQRLVGSYLFIYTQDLGFSMVWMGQDSHFLLKSLKKFQSIPLLTCAKLSFPESLRFLHKCSFQEKLFTLSINVLSSPGRYKPLNIQLKSFHSSMLVMHSPGHLKTDIFSAANSITDH